MHAPLPLSEWAFVPRERAWAPSNAALLDSSAGRQEQERTVRSGPRVQVILTLQVPRPLDPRQCHMDSKQSSSAGQSGGQPILDILRPSCWTAMETTVYKTELLTGPLARGRLEGAGFSLCRNHKNTKCNGWDFDCLGFKKKGLIIFQKQPGPSEYGLGIG